jgi:hypothetical protein
MSEYFFSRTRISTRFRKAVALSLVLFCVSTTHAVDHPNASTAGAHQAAVVAPTKTLDIVQNGSTTLIVVNIAYANSSAAGAGL